MSIELFGAALELVEGAQAKRQSRRYAASLAKDLAIPEGTRFGIGWRTALDQAPTPTYAVPAPMRVETKPAPQYRAPPALAPISETAASLQRMTSMPTDGELGEQQRPLLRAPSRAPSRAQRARQIRRESFVRRARKPRRPLIRKRALPLRRRYAR